MFFFFSIAKLLVRAHLHYWVRSIFGRTNAFLAKEFVRTAYILTKHLDLSFLIQHMAGRRLYHVIIFFTFSPLLLNAIY